MIRHADPVRFWLLQLGLAISWIVVWHLGRVLEHTDHASLWFPAAALTFALYLTVGPWATVPVLAGSVVVTFQSAVLHGYERSTTDLLVSGLAFGISHALAYGAGAWLFARFRGRDRLGTPGSVILFLLVTTVASLLAAVTGLLSLQTTGIPVPGGLGAHFVPWWIGDLVALVSLVPLFLAGADRAARWLGLPSSGWLESLDRLGPGDMPLGGFLTKLVSSVVLAAGLAVLAAGSRLGMPVALVAYVLIIPLMWIAHTEGGLRTVVAVAVLATTVVAVTRWFGLTEQVFDYQAAMITIAGVGLFNLTVPRLFADNERLRHLVNFDRLTGARSRAVFMETAEEIVDRRRGSDTTISLVFFDIDHFKSVNDTAGHAAGDAVLARIGEVCRDEIRSIDLFGRLGGEEFAILLPRTQLSAAGGLAERLRTALEAAEWSPVLAGRSVTASLGVVEVREGEPFRQALDRADAALYRAKAAGRNCVRLG